MSNEADAPEDCLAALEASDSPEALQRYLLDCIPLLQHMEVSVNTVQRDGVTLKAPLAPNSNHIGTAFGGSLHGLGTLAAWGLLWVLLRDQPDVHLVIRDSRMRYLEPAEGELTARCPTPNMGLITQFLRGIARRSKSAIELHSTVEANGRVCAEFGGVFVAIRRK
ncbi:YiiD C-terminal domain-containing protein [Natronospira bacteriovora]|uniref:YiiD C-terminal domain-containing protein n=1 Tax=Natronospira bacteriovora TaxID=3069753 RepID=A0ABU0W404_9GAMM|nr:YiiD C-terminal domain-containing protein [Natronospira sp. AB-CW4]MDQ2068749.1 YiiD C-terminal domain-containing protein [Natronospira sp. AB-CW4]